MAARGINKVILVGNLGQDPETKFTASGGAITNISIATSESWKDKQTGQMSEKTEWHRVVFFNKLAEIAGEYLRKGSKVYVEGRLQTRKWQDQNGQDRYTTEIVAGELQMLDSREGAAQNAPQAQQQNTGYQQQAQQNQGGYQQQGAPQQQGGYKQPNNGQQQQPQQTQGHGGYQNQQPSSMDDYSDDIPF